MVKVIENEEKEPLKEESVFRSAVPIAEGEGYVLGTVRQMLWDWPG